MHIHEYRGRGVLRAKESVIMLNQREKKAFCSCVCVANRILRIQTKPNSHYVTCKT